MFHSSFSFFLFFSVLYVSIFPAQDSTSETELINMIKENAHFRRFTTFFEKDTFSSKLTELIEKRGFDMEKTFSKSTNFLCYALEYGFEREVIEVIIEKCPENEREDLIMMHEMEGEKKVPESKCALQIALKSYDLTSLLCPEVSPERILAFIKSEDTLIQYNLFTSNSDAFILLLKKLKKEEINSYFVEYLFPLSKHNGVALDFILNLYFKNFCTDLRFLIKNFEELLKDFLKSKNENAQTILHTICLHEEGISRLIYYWKNFFGETEAYSLVGSQDSNGNTALHLAALNENSSKVYNIFWLIIKEYDGRAHELLTIKNGAGKTPLHLIIETKKESYVVLSLFEKFADKEKPVGCILEGLKILRTSPENNEYCNELEKQLCSRLIKWGEPEPSSIESWVKENIPELVEAPSNIENRLKEETLGSIEAPPQNDSKIPPQEQSLFNKKNARYLAITMALLAGTNELREKWLAASPQKNSPQREDEQKKKKKNFLSVLQRKKLTSTLALASLGCLIVSFYIK